MRTYSKKPCVFNTMIVILSILFLSCSSENDRFEPIEKVFTPIIEFSYSPDVLRAQQEINFTGRWATGSSVIETWRWDFGDDLASTENTKDAVFVYPEEGTFKVSLTATDADGASSTVSQDITVIEPLKKPFEASIAWSFSNETAIPNPNDASKPAIGDDGTIYYSENYANADSRIVAVEDLGATASKKWEVLPGYRIRQSPAIGPNGNLYIGLWAVDESIVQVNTDSGNFVYFDGVGAGISNSTTAIDQTGNIYYGTRSEGIFSFDVSGTERWNFQSSTSGARYYASPALSADGTIVYAMMTNGEIYAINTADGSAKWSEPYTFDGDGTGASLSIDADGTIYYTTSTEVGAIQDNGTSGSVKWSYATTGANSSGVSIGLESTLYVGTASGLVSLNATDGSENWTYETIIEESVPAVDNDGNVYVGTKDGLLLVINSDGELLKQFNLSDNIVNSPLITDDGNIFVEAYDGSKITLHKITVINGSGPAETAWPMKGQNGKNTASAIIP
ncbi:PQQ-binding-like beta-propeller repeat protein [Spongiimicrobium sp. 3-5]|uniref:outer membrane protein assembly factor BamB family protein n=1 Tax=Spongiimicrobium sp. 3-5 TaxID=3332596 RepID=UPI0039811A68